MAFKSPRPSIEPNGPSITLLKPNNLAETEAPTGHLYALPVPIKSGDKIRADFDDESSAYFMDRTADLDDHLKTLELNDTPPALLKEHTIEMLEAKVPEHVATKAADAFQPGQVVRDRYVIEELIGEGGFAMVYRAHDVRRDAADDPNFHVALKVMRPELRKDARAIARLRREYRQTKILSHPNIVRSFDLDVYENVWFIVMELLKGETLAARLRRCKHGNAIALALPWLKACAEALEYAHQHNVTHGDFKPTNVFVLQDDSVRIIDFGSASEISSTSSDNPVQIDRSATPAYASPQVLARLAAVPRDDLFSLACVAYEILANSHPFSRRSILEMQTHNKAPTESAVLSAPQKAALKQALAWHREDRPDSVREFFSLLTARESADVGSQNDGIDIPHDTTPNAQPPCVAAKIEPVSLSAQPARELLEIAPQSNTGMARPAPFVGSALPRDKNYSAFLSSIKNFITRTAPPRSLALQTLQKLSLDRWPSAHLRHYSWLALVAVLCLGVLNSENRDAKSDSRQVDKSIGTQVPLAQSDEASSVEVARQPTGSSPDIKLPAKPAPLPKALQKSTVSFETSSMTASEHAVAAAIAIKRNKDSAGRLKVTWRIREDSAKSGKDFSGPMSGVAEFFDGQLVRTIFIPLLQNPERSSNRTFTVELAGAPNNAAVGAVRSIGVTILETGAPAVAMGDASNSPISLSSN